MRSFVWSKRRYTRRPSDLWSRSCYYVALILCCEIQLLIPAVDLAGPPVVAALAVVVAITMKSILTISVRAALTMVRISQP